MDAINQVAALSLTPPLISPLSGGDAAFFRVQQVPRAASLDTDADGIPDAYELQHPPLDGLNPADAQLDLDGDRLGTAFEIAYRLDPRLRDTDGNGVHDGDEDFDNDFVTNRVEFQRGLNPRRADTDGDGWLDEAELTGESDPRDAASTPRLLGVARPATQLVLPLAPQLDPTDTGLTLARPTVQIALPAASTAAPEGWGPTSARPVVRLRPQP